MRSEKIKCSDALRDATTAGLHVLLEKPMASSVAECDEIARLAEGAGVVLMLGLTHRFHAELVRARVLIAFNKPFGVACKFSPEPGRKPLADYIDIRSVYPAGRLDADSEGLLLLTDDGVLQARISHPRHKQAKTYWAQVERIPDAAALAALRWLVAESRSCSDPRWRAKPPTPSRRCPPHWLDFRWR